MIISLVAEYPLMQIDSINLKWSNTYLCTRILNSEVYTSFNEINHSFGLLDIIVEASYKQEFWNVKPCLLHLFTYSPVNYVRTWIAYSDDTFMIFDMEGLLFYTHICYFWIDSASNSSCNSIYSSELDENQIQF